MSTHRLYKRVFMFMLAILLVLPSLAARADDAKTTGFSFDFNDGTNPFWGDAGVYKITPKDGALEVKVSKDRNTWAVFGYNTGALDLSANPYVSLKIKSDTDMLFGIWIMDASNNAFYPTPMATLVNKSTHETVITYSYTQTAGVDLTTIKTIGLIANPATPGAKGTLIIDDFKGGDQAAAGPHVDNVWDQQTWINAPEQTVTLRDIRNTDESGNPITFSATSSNFSLIPDPTISYSGGDTATLRYTPQPDQFGTATITVTETSGGTTKTVLFDVSVENNLAPKLDQARHLEVKAGELQRVRLTEIDDGNPNARQAIALSAVSSDPTLIPEVNVEYTSDNRWGDLLFTPAADRSGTATVTVTAHDDGGTTAGGVDTGTMSFDVSVFEDLNHDPTVATIADVTVDENSAGKSVDVSSLTDGDGGAQQLSVTATSSDASVVPDPTVTYTPGSATGQLNIVPAVDKTGTVVITVTVSDNGGTADNNGSKSVQTSFNVKVRPAPITGFVEDFNDNVKSPNWADSNGGLEIHTLTVENQELRIDVAKGSSPWAGLWYGTSKELDMTNHPYISIKMKVSPAPKDVVLFLWDAQGLYTTARAITKTVTADYADYYYDMTDRFIQGDGQKLDPSRITALMWTFAPAESNWNGTFWFDDLRVGDQANRENAASGVTINGVADFALAQDAGTQSAALTGIANGEDTNGVTVTASSSNTALIADPIVSPVANGTATLEFTPAPGQTGSATITVNASAGSASTQTTFKVDVLDKTAPQAVNVAVDRNTRYQTIDGFGAFYGAGDASDVRLKLLTDQAKDMGATIARYGIIDRQFEPGNDNSDPNVADYGKFDEAAIALNNMKVLTEQAGIEKSIMTFWSPAAFLKKNKWLTAENWAQNNVIDSAFYEEYAEQLVTLVKTVKYRTNIDLYAISLQNEPDFNEPYASSVMSPTVYRDLLKVVGPRFEREGITTKIFMPEALEAQHNIQNFINLVDADPVARQYVDIVAVHNYDTDGIHVGGPGAQGWTDIWNWAQQSPAKPTWMTETSGHSKDWSGAMVLAANLYQALHYGNISAWVFWDYYDNLTTDGTPNDLYYVSKQYYKYIQPGARRIQATSGSSDVLSLSFDDPSKHRFTSVLINNSDSAKVVRIAGDALPTAYEAYLSSKNRHFERQFDISDNTALLPANSVMTLYSAEELPEPPEPPTDDQAPAAPADLGVTGQTDSTVTLTWTASTDNVGVTGYDVYNGDVKVNAAPITETTYTVEGLTAGTAYSFSVKATDAAGNISAASNTVHVSTNGGAGLLVSDSFDAAAGKLNGTAEGIGFYEPWNVQNGDEDIPGYNVADTAPLGYSLLEQSGNYAVGGNKYLTAYRMLDTKWNGTLKDYAVDEQLGKPGQTIWYSALLRKDKDNNEPVWVGGGAFTTPNVAAGFFSGDSVEGGTKYWSLQLGGTVYKSNVPVVIGQPVLLVMRLDFGDTNTARLYVNPASLGGAEPAPEEAQATAASTSSPRFSMINFLGGNGPGNGSVDEIRLGTTYSSVTPKVNDTSAPTAPTGVAASAVTATSVTLTWTASTDNVGVTSYDIIGSNSPVGSTSDTSFTITGLTAATSYTFVVKAKDAAGNISAESGQVQATTAPAPDTPTSVVLTASKGVVMAGDEFKVTATANNANDLYGFLLNMSYDSDLYELTGYKVSDAFKGTADVYVYDKGGSGQKSIVAALLGQDAGRSGSTDLLEFTFTVLSTSHSGSIAVTNGSMVSDSTGRLSQIDNVSLNVPIADPDIDHDGDVDLSDLVKVAYAFGNPSKYEARFEMNGDGKIDIVDLVFIASKM